MFKPTLLVASAAVAVGAAQAETFKINDTTTFEVNVDVGAYYVSEKNADGKSEAQIAGKGMNQVEIKADHKMADGVKVFGEIEIDYDPIKDNDAVKTDDVKLGLSGGFGKVMVGQFDSFAEDKIFETLGIGHGEYGFVSEPASGNDGRHLQYSNSFGDLKLGLDLTHKAGAEDATAAKTGIALGMTYKLSGMTLGFAHDKITGFDTDGKAAKAKSTTGMSIQYKLGEATLLGLAAQTTPVSGGAKTKYAGLGVTYDMGAVNLGLAYQQVKTGDTKTNETSLGVSYELYKNMLIYADVLKTGAAKGEGDALEVGVAYSF